MAEAAEQASVALVPQVIKTNSFLLAVELHNGGNVMAVLALVTTCAHALGEVEADLGVVDGRIIRPCILHRGCIGDAGGPAGAAGALHICCSSREES